MVVERRVLRVSVVSVKGSVSTERALVGRGGRAEIPRVVKMKTTVVTEKVTFSRVQRTTITTPLTFVVEDILTIIVDSRQRVAV